MIFCLIKEWSVKKGFTINVLKEISNLSEGRTERAVCELQRIHMISMDTYTGEIMVSSDNPYDSYAWYVALNMKILDESLESFTRRDPELTSAIKAKLLDLPAPCIIKRRLVVLFWMFFKDDTSQNVKGKISEIRSSVEKRETFEMSSDFSCAWLESEIRIFIYFLRMAIFNCPFGIVWKSDVFSFFGRIGYKEEDIQNILSYLCSVRVLEEDSKGDYKVREIESGIWRKIHDIPSIQLPKCIVP